MGKRRVPILCLLTVELALVVVLLLVVVDGQGHAAAAPGWRALGEHPVSAARDASVGGVITQSTTWSAADSPYVLSADVIVTSGVTLTIEPGVTVRGNSGTQLQVRGHLDAVGAQEIMFTSSADSGPGQWEGLHFVGGTGHLRHVIVRYAGQNNGFLSSSVTVRDVAAGEVRIESSQVLSGHRLPYTDYGLYATNSRLVISDTLFAHNGNSVVDVPLRVEAADLHQIQLVGNRFQDNANDQVFVEGGSLAGPASLSAQAELNAYRLNGEVLVPAGITLTVEPGVTIKGASEVHVEVQGHLEAKGWASLPITFTSSADDGPGQWEGLYFNGGTGDLQYVTVRYAGQNNGFVRSSVALRDVVQGQVRLEDSQIRDGARAGYQDYGVYVENSRLTMVDSGVFSHGDSVVDVGLYATGGSTVDVVQGAFDSNAGYGLWINDSHAVLTCTAILENQDDGIYLTGSSTTFSGTSARIVDNAGLGLNNATGTTIDARFNWWGDASGPYHPTLNPGGTGDEVSDDVSFYPWAEVPYCFLNRLVYVPWVLAVSER